MTTVASYFPLIVGIVLIPLILGISWLLDYLEAVFIRKGWMKPYRPPGYSEWKPEPYIKSEVEK
jgi:hypothetical protein